MIIVLEKVYMEDRNTRGDLHGNVVRQILPPGFESLKSTLSGRFTLKSSPSFGRLHSSTTPHRESKATSSKLRWIQGSSFLFWLILFTLWAYKVFLAQSKWVHTDHSKAEFIGYRSNMGSVKKLEGVIITAGILGANTIPASRNEPLIMEGKKDLDSKKNGLSLVMEGRQVSFRQIMPRKKGRRSATKHRRRVPVKPKSMVGENRVGEVDEGIIPSRNSSYGLIMGPFGKTEERILGWSREKRKGTCDKKSEFARIVQSRSFVLIFHELSMTGAPLSMMELAMELSCCGGIVSAVALSKKGGLMGELDRRGIKMLKDKGELSYKTAMKADLIIAGSAVCSSWIEKYLSHFTDGSSQIVWWIMENRREYFDRSKHMLHRVKMLTFLSDSQSKQWLAWCEEEKIQLNSQPMVVPLSVNDELAFVAGIPSSLNTPAFSVEKMLEKRNLLRSAVRKEMGLGDNDMLVMSLSSINPGKGQLLLLKSALLVADHNNSMKDFKSNGLLVEEKLSGVTAPKPRALFQYANQSDKLASKFHQDIASMVASKKRKIKHLRLSNLLSLGTSNKTVTCTSNKTVTWGDRRKLRNLFSVRERKEETLKVLIGSVGSKSNKVPYIEGIFRFLSEHLNLSKLVLWTPTTTDVASLYSAADVYVINAQGAGETFGRVTIEAMAFGLPVLGTNAGGTQEIVEHNVTGLLHPRGRGGTQALAQNFQFLLSNPTAREKMGMSGRLKVQRMYLKRHMYQRFASVLDKCIKIKVAT